MIFSIVRADILGIKNIKLRPNFQTSKLSIDRTIRPFSGFLGLKHYLRQFLFYIDPLGIKLKMFLYLYFFWNFENRARYLLGIQGVS